MSENRGATTEREGIQDSHGQERGNHAFLPYLVALSSPLVVLANNPGELPTWEILARVFGVALVFTGTLHLLTRFLWSSPGRELLLCSMLLYVGGFGYLEYALSTWEVSAFVAYVAWTLVFLVLVVGIRASLGKTILDRIASLLQYCLLSLVLVLAATLSFSLLRGWSRPLSSRPAANSAFSLATTTLTPMTPDASSRPDIYYIILDGYGGEDVLRESYSLDNRPFLDALRERGFFVASKGRSNYSQTNFSLSSSLNMTYLNDLNIDTPGFRGPMWQMMFDGRVQRMLEDAGYTSIAIESPYFDFTLFRHYYQYFDRCHSYGDVIRLSEFEEAWIQTTLVKVLFKRFVGYHAYRKRFAFQFLTLSDIAANSPCPKFVFVHIVSPHPPFVFDSQGNHLEPRTPFSWADGNSWFDASPERTRDDYVRGYREQLLYLNDNLLEVVDDILASSRRPPIIILQGDHGARSMYETDDEQKTNMRECFSILNAVRLPPGGDDRNASPYPSMTPVNTFRIIFDRYFQTSFGLLKDRQYYQPFSKPYQFIDVTDRCESR